jgi:acetyl esterase/lipase
MASSAEPSAPRVVVDECRGVLFVYSDGTVERRAQPGFSTPVRDDGSVEWKDVEFDAAAGLGLRLYRPRDRGGRRRRLPVFFYYHGGGFCIGSRTWPNVQNYCLRLAADLGALVVAPDYRLAPEHRLPAALDDGAAAVLWLAAQAREEDDGAGGGDPWVAESADLARVFVSGDSAGGTIAHHLAVRFGSPAGRAELAPAAVRGYVQLMPFFGGVQRTRSEAECPDDAFLNRPLNDRYWRLSLPEGATADHPVSNPFGPGAPPLEGVDIAPTLVVVGGRDILHDRAVDYAARLKAMGKPVEVRDFEGQQHGFFTIDPWSDASAELMRVIKRFVDSDGRFE